MRISNRWIRRRLLQFTNVFVAYFNLSICIRKEQIVSWKIWSLYLSVLLFVTINMKVVGTPGICSCFPSVSLHNMQILVLFFVFYYNFFASLHGEPTSIAFCLVSPLFFCLYVSAWLQSVAARKCLFFAIYESYLVLYYLLWLIWEFFLLTLTFAL